MAYCSVAQVRAVDASIPISALEVPDANVTLAIAEATRLIDMYTGTHFELLTFDSTTPLILSGNGRRTVALSLPPKPLAGSVTKVTLDDLEIDTDDITFAMGAVWPDDRRAPKMSRASGSVWDKGLDNIELEGLFGFVEAGSYATPPAIVTLTARVAMLILAQEGYQTPKAVVAGFYSDEAVKESGGGRSIERPGVQGTEPSQRSTPFGIFLLDRVIWQYRRTDIWS